METNYYKIIIFFVMINNNDYKVRVAKSSFPINKEQRKMGHSSYNPFI